MLASSILSVFAALSFGITSLAAPVANERAELATRDIDIPSVLATLAGKVATYTALIDAAVLTSDTASLEEPLTGLKSAFEDATADVKGLNSTDATPDAIASLYAPIIEKVATSLGPVKDLTETADRRRQLDLGSLLDGLIAAINPLSLALNQLVDGLLELVGQLLVAVAALVKRLGIALENF